MNPTPGVIRTPDQRLRVFVSSTLKELAPERRVTRAAVERLHLAPVMFELGARPHPPRELYRAYLQQSDVFVGIYGDSYGWVAPGEAVSGLEDEYNLAGSLPKLIYIRESPAGRDERLRALLDRVRDDDRASFKYFSSAQELRRLIEADLATLLAERFDQSRAEPASETAPDTAPARVSAIPAPLTGLIGRDREVATVEELLSRDAVRLVTLIGSGGIGKSRVAMAIAARERKRGEHEVVFVDLTPVQDAALVPNAIGQALGVLDIGDESVLDKLKTALRDRDALIVVDNFEQVLPAATTLIALLSEAAAVKFLVTSRTLLRVSGEYAVEVGPLELPEGSSGIGGGTVPASVALFVERARAVKPDFELTPVNSAAVAAICVALDGVPLALELAAARIRMLTPESMLARLDRRLSLLAGGARDLPARQQTLRSTIEWSTQLLGRDERRLLERLGVFSGGFSLEAVEAVAGGDGGDPIYGLGVLVDNSLVREQDRNGRSYFSMLATVHEYALEQLGASGVLATTRAAHAAYFTRLAKSLEEDLEDAGLRDAISVLNADRDNLRATARHYLDSGDFDAVAEFTWTLLIYWWVGGLLGEVRGWMDEVLTAPGVQLNDRTKAIALYFTRSITLWHDSTESVVPGLTESAKLFHRVKDRQAEGMALIFLGLAGLADKPPDPERAEKSLDESLRVLRSIGDDWGEAMALVTLGRVALMKRALHEATDHFEASLSLARRRRDDLGTAIALHHLGWATMVQGDRARARELFEESLATAARLGHAEGVAYGLEGLTAIAAAEQDVRRAGLLLRASESLRNQTGLHTATRFSFHEHYLAPILAGEHAEELERARTEGSDLSMDDAVKFALGAGA
jgi:predicted ATPase